jgi:hypothetical protein
MTMQGETLTDNSLDIEKLEMKLLRVLTSSSMLRAAFDRAPLLGIEDYYIGAGCVAQTVWNHLSGKPLNYGIKDIDFVWFDAARLDYDSENEVILRVKDLYRDFPVEVDAKNQARVHLWYGDHFGYAIAPYGSLEAAIDSWPTTATSIGVRRDGRGDWKVYAPFGLDDLFGRVVRANKKQITKEIYENKVKSWLMKWPDLTVIPWDA